MNTLEPSPPSIVQLEDLTTEDFLRVVGQRVRQQRARKSMSRKRLAEVSTVSERYLAQLESGQGNMSIALLRKVASAIGITLESLMSEQVSESCISRLNLAQYPLIARQSSGMSNGGSHNNAYTPPNRVTTNSGARHNPDIRRPEANVDSERIAEV